MRYWKNHLSFDKWQNICGCCLKVKQYDSKQKNFDCHGMKSRNANCTLQLIETERK